MVTKDWMMMVLRSGHSYQGIPVNSLGYLGLLYSKNDEMKEIFQRIQPIELLQALSVPMHQNHRQPLINGRRDDDPEYFYS
jgi:ATP adenylyltransferase